MKSNNPISNTGTIREIDYNEAVYLELPNGLVNQLNKLVRHENQIKMGVSSNQHDDKTDMTG